MQFQRSDLSYRLFDKIYLIDAVMTLELAELIMGAICKKSKVCARTESELSNKAIVL